MTGFSSTPRKRKKAQPQTPRVICVTGLPLSGVSAMLAVLSDSVETPVAVIDVREVDYTNEDDTKNLDAEIRKRLSEGAEVVYLENFSLESQAIQWVADTRLLADSNGSLIRVWADDEHILARAKQGARDDITADLLSALRKDNTAGEELARKLHVSTFMIANEDLVAAVADLVQRSGIRK